ncbi:MAG TPA: penicillin-binding protein 2 [Anaerolineales bacterium]|nr:penicillin-binding protein 2 [Anaerolineales bacterium]
MSNQGSWRFTTLGILLTALAVFIIIQMLRIQLSPQAGALRDKGELYSGTWRTITPARGQIYDRWGHLLAANNSVYEVGVILQEVENPSTIALALNAVIDSDYDEVFAAASTEPSADAVYATLARFVTEDQKQRLEKLSEEMQLAYGDRNDSNRPSLAGITFDPRLQRSYPEKDLASNILGFVNWEGEGFFGVEEKFNDELAGSPERVWIPFDPNRVEEFPQVPQGSSLILTIDRVIQAEMEEIVEDAIEESGSESATILVMDPKNGDILAAATSPRLDLNEFWRYGEVYEGSTPFNRVVSETYEPGSVFKVLTMAAAIDGGAVKPKTTFLDTGSIEVGGTIIRNWNSGAWGPQDMLGCMQHSLNVCLAWVATQLGANKFYQYMQDFGLGHLTGVDMAGENPGRLKLPGDEDWYEADLGTNAFGQGVAVTPVQMLKAVSALANDGQMVVPRIVLSMIDDGKQYNTSPRISGAPITAKTAQRLTEMLSTSLEVESSSALVEGYRVAGKTGTAEIPTPFGYTSNLTNASFVGWGPVDEPRFLVYVWLEKPTTSPWGSVVAAPVFRQVVERLVVLMNIPSDEMKGQLLEGQ